MEARSRKGISRDFRRCLAGGLSEHQVSARKPCTAFRERLETANWREQINRSPVPVPVLSLLHRVLAAPTFRACRAPDGDHTLGSVRQHTCCMAVDVKSERSAERRGPMRQFADGPWALLCTLCPSGSGRSFCHSERAATFWHSGKRRAVPPFQRPGPFTRVSELSSSAVGG